MTEAVILYLILAFIIGAGANARGRSGSGWFFLALLISPLISGLLLLLLPRRTAVVGSDGEAVSPRTHVRCPDCRELVRIDASKCRYCGCNLVPQPISSEDGSASTGKAIILTVAVLLAIFVLAKCTR